MKSLALHVAPMPTEHATSYWSGRPDANGQSPQWHVSDGNGIPCRHCLRNVNAGEPYLTLSYRPFNQLQPYAECGPIFIHAESCVAYNDGERIPAIYLNGEPRIVRGYDAADRIVYGTGRIVDPGDIATYARELLNVVQVDYVHVRSSQNNCYAFRIDLKEA